VASQQLKRPFRMLPLVAGSRANLRSILKASSAVPANRIFGKLSVPPAGGWKLPKIPSGILTTLKIKPSAKAGDEDLGSAEGSPGNWKGDGVSGYGHALSAPASHPPGNLVKTRLCEQYSCERPYFAVL